MYNSYLFLPSLHLDPCEETQLTVQCVIVVQMWSPDTWRRTSGRATRPAAHVHLIWHVTTVPVVYAAAASAGIDSSTSVCAVDRPVPPVENVSTLYHIYRSHIQQAIISYMATKYIKNYIHFNALTCLALVPNSEFDLYKHNLCSMYDKSCNTQPCLM